VTVSADPPSSPAWRRRSTSLPTADGGTVVVDLYAAGVGSPLEHAFLRLFEQHGLTVEKQVAIGPDLNGPAISTADFVVSGARVAICR
jgi:hypothetical protein